jgi:hypothetical protein
MDTTWAIPARSVASWTPESRRPTHDRDRRARRSTEKAQGKREHGDEHADDEHPDAKAIEQVAAHIRREADDAHRDRVQQRIVAGENNPVCSK